MKLQTPVADAPCKVGVSYEDKILMLGSCFVDNIGRQLADFNFDVCVNPFGTLYNPLSILQAVRRLNAGNPFTEDECVQMGSGSMKICSFSHHTSFAACSSEEFLEKANLALKCSSDFFSRCNKVVITLGTAWCYRHVEGGNVVSNCLKRDAKEFVRELLTVEEVVSALREITNLCPGKKIIFTVSPIRHFRDGAHANQISKSTLLLAVDRFMEEYGRDVDYFPSYEIMMDELRDYRFYAEDMCHPTAQAAEYIRERFLAWALPEEENERLKREILSFKRSRHIERF